MLSDATTALRGINAREDVDAATFARVFLPFEAAKIEGVDYGGAVVSLWGIFEKIRSVDPKGEMRLSDFVNIYHDAWCELGKRLRFPDELRAAMYDALHGLDSDDGQTGAMEGEQHEELDGKLRACSYPAHKYAERVRRFHETLSDAMSFDAAAIAGDSLTASVVGEGSRRAKQRPAEVSIYAGKEVPGEGAYIGKRIAVDNDGRSITLKNNERASGKRYTYYPRTIPLVDALVNQFANSGGWLEPKGLMKKIGKDGKKWQSLIDDKKTLKAAIESEVVNNRPTGRIRLKAAAFE